MGHFYSKVALSADKRDDALVWRAPFSTSAIGSFILLDLLSSDAHQTETLRLLSLIPFLSSVFQRHSAQPHQHGTRCCRCLAASVQSSKAFKNAQPSNQAVTIQLNSLQSRFTSQSVSIETHVSAASPDVHCPTVPTVTCTSLPRLHLSGLIPQPEPLYDAYASSLTNSDLSTPIERGWTCLIACHVSGLPPQP